MKKNVLLLIFLMAFCVVQSQRAVNSGDAKFGLYYEQRVTHFRSLPVASKKVAIFLGDSITDGAEWSELFGRNQILNRGISGDVTAGVLHRLDEVLRHKPKKIFLLIGTNDLARNIRKEEVIANIIEIVRRTASASPKTKVYVQSIFPVNPVFVGNFSGHLKNKDLIDSVNMQLRQNQDEYGFTFLDVAASLMDRDGFLNTKYTNDGLHLSGEGYRVWAATIKGLLK